MRAANSASLSGGITQYWTFLLQEKPFFLASASPFRGLSPNSTIFPASNRNDRLAYPCCPSYRAMTMASAAPSRIFGTGGVSRRFRSSARSKPSSTKFRRMFSTVCLRHENASAIFRSVHAGPSASAFNRIQARRTLSLLPFSLRIVSWQISRSSAVSRTSCTWECLSVAHAKALDRKYNIAYQFFY